MKPTTRDWLTFARKDLVNCEHILQDEFLTNIVAFHAQQANVSKSNKQKSNQMRTREGRIDNKLALAITSNLT